ncbi:MAG: DUF1848 domain-containing protein [Anaerofustis sp.]
MIISASRRTDIPAFYSDWFFNRYREGFVLVRNPMNPRQISKVSLSPDVADGIVFWTKNPAPMLSRLDELGGVPYYFQFTLNPYRTDVEVYVPSKNDSVIRTFQTLSDRIGAHRVVWRYDPILINQEYTEAYHLRQFETLAKLLENHTQICTVSFVDQYKKTLRNAQSLGIQSQSARQKKELLRTFSQIAQASHLRLRTCAEDVDCSDFGIENGACIDASLLSTIGGIPLQTKKDRNQRLKCGCAESIDIGAYNTCLHGCRYCYANASESTVKANAARYDASAPMLCSSVGAEDRVTVREMRSCRRCQIGMLDGNQFLS